MKRLLLRGLAGLVGLVVVALLVATSGLPRVKASSDHWAVTAWFLHYAMARSVAVDALGTQVPPDLRDDGHVLRGAGHYETGCRPCHGAPGGGLPVLARHMTPQPPWLPDRTDDWTDAELFRIVRHGVKFTGMPAWPVEGRDDEVWALVAFLRRLPDLDAAAYDALVTVDGPPPSGPVARLAASACARCHGPDGEGHAGAAIPRLAGQRPAYLEASLEAYADGDRHSGIMGVIAARLDPSERAALARHYATRPAPGPPADVDPDAAERGERLASGGVPGVPACVACHGPTPHPRLAAYPTLAGQHADYLALQLQLFREDQRGGTPWADVMQAVLAHDLTEEGARDVSAWYASLPQHEAAFAVDSPAGGVTTP